MMDNDGYGGYDGYHGWQAMIVDTFAIDDGHKFNGVTMVNIQQL